MAVALITAARGEIALLISSRWLPTWRSGGYLLLCGVKQQVHDQVAPLTHLVEAMCLSLAATNINAECPLGKAPKTRVRLLISRIIRSSGLLTGMIIRGALASLPAWRMV
jgi:hypothetical protein